MLLSSIANVERGWKADARPGFTTARRSARLFTPACQPLEQRALLSGYNAPALIQPVVSPSGIYLIEVAGPGYVSTQPAGNGAVNVRAYGTTSQTTITVVQARPRPHVPNGLLNINLLTLRSGQLGNLDASVAALTGRVSPITGGITTFDVGAIEPKAQVDITGNVGSMSAGAINIGPTGRFVISGDLNNLAESQASTTGVLPVEPLSQMTIGSVNVNGGLFKIGRDSLSSVVIQDNLTLNHDGVFSIGRDQNGTFSVNGSLILDTGGQLTVGRNLNDLVVNGNVIVNPSGSGIVVHGALNGFTVNGYFQGQGGLSAPSQIDLGVGLNLSNFNIEGGVTGQGGLINANVTAGGTVSSVGIVYGTYNSSVLSNTTMTT